jgi:hypothetical protein
MHVIMTIAGGFSMLGLFLLFGKLWGGDTSSLVLAAKAFMPVWLVTSLVNFWIGVHYAGYSVREELLILAVVFALPVAAALWSIWIYLH